jgi:hypothetical protein
MGFKSSGQAAKTSSATKMGEFSRTARAMESEGRASEHHLLAVPSDIDIGIKRAVFQSRDHNFLQLGPQLFDGLQHQVVGQRPGNFWPANAIPMDPPSYKPIQTGNSLGPFTSSNTNTAWPPTLANE